MDLVERSIKRRLDAGESISDEEWRIWYEYHPELKPADLVEAEKLASDPAFIPDIEVSDRIDDDLQPFLDGIDILDAYERWSGKNFTPKVGNKRESIMISCPIPGHVDNDPSAWVNLDKQVWYCEPCSQGGDKFDIAAYAHGYAVPDYKRNGDFPKLRRDMVTDFGGLISRTPGGKEIITAPIEVPPPEAEPSKVNGNGNGNGNAKIVKLADLEPETEDEKYESFMSHGGVRIEWEQIIPKDTFLRMWMNSTAVLSDMPHEYYFWLGMQAVGAAIGHDVFLADQEAVYGNLMVCLYGRTSSGKSRSVRPYTTLLDEALPYDFDPTKASKGVKVFQSIGSSESLMDQFIHELKDPSSGAVTGRAPVRGLMYIPEFASFISKAAATKSPMKDTLMNLFDGSNRVSHVSRSGGATVVDDPYCMALTTTQPKAIHNYLNKVDADSGFLNRWIIATGVRRRDRIAYGGAKMVLDDCVKALKSIHAWSGFGHELHLSGDALDLWIEFHREQVDPVLDGPEDESMLGRINLHLKKIIVLLTANQMLDRPTFEVVQAAIELFPYITATAQIVTKAIAYTEQEACQNRILEIVTRWESTADKGPSRRDIWRVARRSFSTEQIDRAIRTMEVLDIITPYKTKGSRGPETVRYKLNA